MSAALFPDGGPAKAYAKATHMPYEAVVSDVVVTELNEVFERKFPQKTSVLGCF